MSLLCKLELVPPQLVSLLCVAGQENFPLPLGRGGAEYTLWVFRAPTAVVFFLPDDSSALCALFGYVSSKVDKFRVFLEGLWHLRSVSKADADVP